MARLHGTAWCLSAAVVLLLVAGVDARRDEERVAHGVSAKGQLTVQRLMDAALSRKMGLFGFGGDDPAPAAGAAAAHGAGEPAAPAAPAAAATAKAPAAASAAEAEAGEPESSDKALSGQPASPATFAAAAPAAPVANLEGEPAICEEVAKKKTGMFGRMFGVGKNDAYQGKINALAQLCKDHGNARKKAVKARDQVQKLETELAAARAEFQQGGALLVDLERKLEEGDKQLKVVNQALGLAG